MRSKTITLSPAESKTYACLGVIAAGAGLRTGLYKTKKRVEKEEVTPNGLLDLTGWFSQQVSYAELSELRDFRNRLFHGAVIVHNDGSVYTYDPETDSSQTLPQDEVEQYAIRFWNIRWENRVTMTTESYSICRCGEKFPQPEKLQESVEHSKTCPVALQVSSESSSVSNP